MASFPKNADVVIIGLGGIVGASVAHHLIAKGWKNIVGIDKSSVPTDIGSTSHASDFCYMTAHDNMTCYTTRYSVAFYDEMGHYSRVGGLEVARHDDDERMAELKRKVGSGKAFGTNVTMISAKEAKEKMAGDKKAMFPFMKLLKKKPAKNGKIEWEAEALERVKNAPDFVRPGIYKLMEIRAKENGYKIITSAFLSEIRDESMQFASRRMNKLGFDELDMEAFDTAKSKTKNTKKREVIDEIKDFLAKRDGKNTEIINKFRKYLSHVTDTKK